MEENNYKIPDTPKYDLGEQLQKDERRKKGAKRIIAIATFLLITFVIIANLGYVFGQFFASSTTLSVRTNQPNVFLASIGFRVDKPIEEVETERYQLHLNDDAQVDLSTPEKTYVYWVDKDAVSNDLLTFMLEFGGYATRGKVSQITSGAFDQNEPNLGAPFSFYNIPPSLNATTFRRHAEHIPIPSGVNGSYMGLTILFRLGVSATGSTTGNFNLDNYGVYFTEKTKIVGTQMIVNALRIGIHSDHRKDIIAPGYLLGKNDPLVGQTPVGGRLDLKNRGFYDHTGLMLVGGEDSQHRYEVAYGEFTHPFTNENWGAATTADGEIPESPTSKDAATAGGVRPLINYTPKTQGYSSIRRYTRLSNAGEPFAYSNPDGITEFDLRIWLEGWDQSVTDEIMSQTFGAQLEFEMRKDL